MRTVKNPRERFKKLSELWKNISVEENNKYKEMSKRDGKRFEKDVAKYHKALQMSKRKKDKECNEDFSDSDNFDDELSEEISSSE